MTNKLRRILNRRIDNINANFKNIKQSFKYVWRVLEMQDKKIDRLEKLLNANIKKIK